MSEITKFENISNNRKARTSIVLKSTRRAISAESSWVLSVRHSVRYTS